MLVSTRLRALFVAITATATAFVALPLLAAPAQAASAVADTASGRAGDHIVVNVNANDGFATDGSVFFDVTDRSDFNSMIEFTDSAAGVAEFTATRTGTTQTFDYTAYDSDTFDELGTARVTVTLTAPGAFNGTDDVISTSPGEVVSFDLGANDTGVTDSDIWNPNFESSTLGSLEIGPRGVGSFEATTGSPTPEVITYEVQDAQGNTLDTVHLTISVAARTVTVHNDALTAIADETTDLDVVANDTGAVASDYIQVGAASGDADVFEQDNHVASFWADSPGTYTFSYQLFDQNDTLLGSATATVTVTPPPPVRARNDFVDVEVHTPTPVDVLGNDTYPGAGSPVLAVTAAPGHGTAAVVAGATPTITYTPAAGFVGTDTFTYRLTVGTDTATATVTVDVARLPVQDLEADPRASGAFVHWTNPTSPDLTSIVVRYAAGFAPPATPTSGTGVTLGGPLASSATVAGLTNGATYSFSVFANYGGTQVGPESASVTPDVQPVSGLVAEGLDQSIKLDWQAPPAGTSLSVRYATGDYPASGAGTPVTVPAGASSVTVPGLVNGTTYYFRVVSTADGRTSDPAQAEGTPRATNVAPRAVDDFVSWYGESSLRLDLTDNDSDADDDSLLVLSHTAPAHGTVTCPTSGSCTYQVGPGSYTTDTFSYTVTDGHGGHDTADVTIARRAPFVGRDDYINAPAWDTTLLDVLANDDGGVPSDFISFEFGGIGQLGSVNRREGPDGNPQYVFRSNGTQGLAVVTYTVFDESFRQRGTGRMVLSVGPEKPVTAVDDSTFTERNTTLSIPVAANDHWTGTTVPTLTFVRRTAHGTVSVNTSGPRPVVVYTPTPGYVGSDRLTYRLTRGTDSDTAEVAITVYNAGISNFDATPGIGVADLTWENPADSTFDHVVLRYDHAAGDPGVGPLTPTTGTALAVPAKAESLHWTGLTNGDTYAVAAFAVYADGTFLRTTTEFTPGIRPVDDLEGDGLNASATLTWTNPTGMTGSVVRYTPAGASHTCPTSTTSGSGLTQSTPAAAATVPSLTNGTTYCFAVFATATGATSAPRTIELTPRATNAAPSAVADPISLDENTFKEVTVSANDTDANGDQLFLLRNTQPTHGFADCYQFGVPITCDYDPGNLFHGTDSFTYVVSDRHGGRATGTVTATVAQVNQAPDVSGERVVAFRNEALPVNVKTNDSDPEGQALTYSVTTPAAHGTATCSAAGACTYTPSTGYLGTDTFGYTASDGSKTDTGSVAIDVIERRHPPLAVDDVATANATAPATVSVLANDTDADHEPLTVIGHTGGHDGTVACTTSACTYTAAAGTSGLDSFTYTISDGNGGVSTATVQMTVVGPNHAPVAADDTATVFVGHQVTKNVLANDTDADGDPLTAAVTSQPAHGTATCTGAGVCTYTSTGSSAGPDSFTYTVSDGRTGSDVGRVDVTVGADPAPVATDDTLTADSGSPATVNVTGNDTDPDGDPLSAALGTGPAHGTATCSGSSCTYTSTAGYTGSDSFSYTLADGHGGTDTGAVAVTVNLPTPDVTIAASPTSLSVKASVVISGKVAPVAAGDPINLERLSGTTWSLVTSVPATTTATGSSASTGTPFSFTVKQPTSATYSYRVVVPATAGHGAATTATVNVGFYAASLGAVAKTSNEYVVVKNSGRVTVNLKRWTITTKARKVLTLPSKVLGAGKSVRIHPGTGRTTSTNIYLRRGKSFNDRHDVLTLKDTRRVVVATKRY